MLAIAPANFSPISALLGSFSKNVDHSLASFAPRPLVGDNHAGFAKRAVIGMFAAGVVDERRIAHLTLHEHDDFYPHVTRGKVGGVDVQGPQIR